MNRLLTLLLALLVAIGPIGGAFAGSHSCASNSGPGEMAVADDMAHADHGRHKSAIDDSSLSKKDCAGCDIGCCQGGLCSMGHCAGTAALLEKTTMLVFGRFAAPDAAATGDRPLAGLLTPPFRPPQV